MIKIELPSELESPYTLAMALGRLHLRAARGFSDGDTSAREHYLHANELIELVGYLHGMNVLGWNPQTLIEHYSEYESVFESSIKIGKKVQNYDDLIYLSKGAVIPVYCPHGHNHSTVSASAPWDECAYCGSLMVLSNDEHYDVLIAADHAA